MSLSIRNQVYSRCKIAFFASLTLALFACASKASVSQPQLEIQSNSRGVQVLGTRNILQMPNVFVAAGTTLEIAQSSQDAVTMLVNTGEHAVTIDGTLTAQGGLIVVSPQGIIFGPQAHILARELVGATLPLQNPEAWLQGTAPLWQAVEVPTSDTVPAVLIRHEGQMQILDTVTLLTQGQLAVAGSILAGRAEGSGGTIRLIGGYVGLFDQATLTAVGKQGPGEIAIGSVSQEASLTPVLTQRIYIGPKGRVQAASGTGTAGHIQIHASESTQAFGSFIAGNTQQGGQVELSAQHRLEVLLAQIDLGSSVQAPGKLLLDPTNLIITTLDSNVSAGTPFQPTADVSRVSNMTLQNALSTGNVTVQTTAGFDAKEPGDLSVRAPILWNSAYGLTLQAAGGVFLFDNIVDTSGGNIMLLATQPKGQIVKYNSSRLYSAGGDIQALADDHITVGDALGANDTSEIRTAGNGNITLVAANPLKGTLDLKSGSLVVENGVIRFGAQQNINLFHDAWNQNELSLLATGSSPGYQIGISSLKGSVYIGSSTTGGVGVSLTTANGGIGIMAPYGEVQFLGAAANQSQNTLMAGGAQGNFLIESERLLIQGGSGTKNFVHLTSQQTTHVWLSAPEELRGVDVTFAMLGGSGEQANVTMNTLDGSQDILVAGRTASFGGHHGMTVQGGSGDLAESLILCGLQPQQIHVKHGDLNILGGSAREANAYVSGHSSDQQVTIEDGNLLLMAGSNGADTQGGISEVDTGTTGSQTISVSGNLVMKADSGTSFLVGDGRGQQIFVGGDLNMVGSNLDSTPGGHDVPSGVALETYKGNQVVTVQGNMNLYTLNAGKIPSRIDLVHYNTSSHAATQQINVGKDLILHNPQGGQSWVRISALSFGETPPATGGPPIDSKILVGHSASIGEDCAITTKFVDLELNPHWSFGTLVVDNAAPTRPGFGTGQLTNEGTLDLGPPGKIFAVSPASVHLGLFVPMSTQFNLWYGEPGSVIGINYKAPKP